MDLHAYSKSENELNMVPGTMVVYSSAMFSAGGWKNRLSKMKMNGLPCDILEIMRLLCTGVIAVD